MSGWNSTHVSTQRNLKNLILKSLLKIFIAFEEPHLLHANKEAHPE